MNVWGRTGPGWPLAGVLLAALAGCGAAPAESGGRASRGSREPAQPPEPFEVAVTAAAPGGDRSPGEPADSARGPFPGPGEGPGAFVPAGPHLENCVLHAGSARGRRDDAGRITMGECGYNAECTAAPGTGMSGTNDGFISMTCSGTACACFVEAGAEGSERHRTPFEIETPCATGDRAEQLFVDYCMAGSYLYEAAPGRARDGSTNAESTSAESPRPSTAP